MSSVSVRQLDAPGARPAEGSARLGDRLCLEIAELIDSGQFPEGCRLPAESVLAERFEVSRPVIREALSRLRLMGAIVSRKGSGSYVRERAAVPSSSAAAPFGPANSLAEVRTCFEFRAAVESEAAYHAALRRAPDDVARLRDALGRIETAIAAGDVGAHSDYDFHLAVARASGNAFFETVMRLMREPMEFAIDLARRLAMARSREHQITVHGEHVVIFDAIERREAERARAAMRRISRTPARGSSRVRRASARRRRREPTRPIGRAPPRRAAIPRGSSRSLRKTPASPARRSRRASRRARRAWRALPP